MELDSSRDALLQTTGSRKDAAADWQIENMVYKTWRLNTDPFGTLVHTLRSMHRMPTGSLPAMGHTLHARGAKTREQLIYHIDLRGPTPPPGWQPLLKSLAKIYEKIA